MTSQSASPLAARVVLLDGSIKGLRQIDSYCSIVGVRAAPFSVLDQLKDFSHSGHLAYLIDGRKLYTGHGQFDRDIGARINKAAYRSSQVYLIYSRDDRFNKLLASYIEARLVDISHQLGIELANRNRPFGADPIVSEDLEQLVRHAEVLLQIAGFDRFESARQSPSTIRPTLAVTGDLHDVRPVEPDQIEIPPTAVRKELVRRDLRAEGYQIGKRLLVLPGGDYCRAERSGLSRHNHKRREAIEAMGILEPVPGREGYQRLIVGLDCKSAAIAATIVTGEHLPTRAWQIASNPEARS